MVLGSAVTLGMGLIGLAAIVAALTSNNTAGIIKNIFDGFGSNLKAALGNH